MVVYRLPIMLDRAWRKEAADWAASEAALVAAQAEATKAGKPPRGALQTGPLTAAPPPAPRAETFNLTTPRSACPACKTPITALQNIPVLSYIVLRGRCARCKTRISARYPIVEAVTGVMSAAVAWKFGFGLPALGGLILTWFLIPIILIDFDTQFVPDNLTYPLLWIGLFLSLWGPIPGATVPVSTQDAVIGALTGYLSLWSVYHVFLLLTRREGMGYGDFKLLAALGAWLGAKMLLPLIIAAAAVGSVVGIVAILASGRDRHTQISFGPFLAAAGWITLMYGREISAYVGLFAVRS